MILTTPIRAIDDLPAQKGELAPEIFQLVGRHRVQVAIPYGNVRVLAWLDRSHPVVEEHLVRRPDRVRPKRRLDVDRLFQTERRFTVGAVQRLAGNRRPQAVSGWKRRHAVVGSAGPPDSMIEVGLEWLEPQTARRPEVSRVIVANPP